MAGGQSGPQKATKKPVDIEFWQCNGDLAQKHKIVAWILENGHKAYIEDNFAAQGPDLIKIVTLEGEMTVLENDVVIKGVQGEFYPCKPDIFNETYDWEPAP